MAVQARGVDPDDIAVPFDGCAQALQHFYGGVDIPEERNIADLMGAGRQDGGDEYGKGGILGTADHDIPGQTLPSLDDQFVHCITSLSMGRASAAPCPLSSAT